MNKKSLVYRVCAYNKALNEPNRLKTMKILGSHAANPVTVSQIAEILHISQPMTTKHLQVLFNIDLIQCKRVGTSKYYSVNIDVVQDYYRLISNAFEATFTPCTHKYMCDECPYTENCM